MQVSLQPEHGYVLAVFVGSWLVHHIYMSIGVVKARKKYGVKYPDLYATEANCKDEKARNAFNCVQRGHQNSLENQPSFLAFLATAGLKYPQTAAIAGAVFLVGKVLYFAGYATGKPNKRMMGAISYIGLFTLIGCTINMAWTLISSNLGRYILGIICMLLGVVLPLLYATFVGLRRALK